MSRNNKDSSGLWSMNAWKKSPWWFYVTIAGALVISILVMCLGFPELKLVYKVTFIGLGTAALTALTFLILGIILKKKGGNSRKRRGGRR